MADPVWHLQNQTATFRSGFAAGQVDAQHPQFGLQHIRLTGELLPDAHVLKVELNTGTEAVGLVEAYVRGGDLVATYEQPGQRPLRAQIYWRTVPAQFAPGLYVENVDLLGGIELVVSVQTSLLDMDPSVITSSLITAQQHLQWDVATKQFTPDGQGGHCTLAQLSDRIWYLEMLHPNDAARPETSHQNSQFRIRHHLFASRLEKGVILRSRIRGLFLLGDLEILEAASHYFDEFAATDPPLTV